MEYACVPLPPVGGGLGGGLSGILLKKILKEFRNFPYYNIFYLIFAPNINF